ncbi:hypothetical protein [Paraoerskovia marina]|uniref:hypothetical protein n=1 Tax=Paraoerskovia marina TaxID=545619 RepID=UPI0012FB4808|nr:hypothetical protein [Paraoerskovia marina]
MVPGPTEIRYMAWTAIALLIGGAMMIGGFLTALLNPSLEGVGKVVTFSGCGFMLLGALFSALSMLKGRKEKRLGYSTAHNELGRTYIGKGNYVVADEHKPEISIQEIIRRNRLNRESEVEVGGASGGRNGLVQQ